MEIFTRKEQKFIEQLSIGKEKQFVRNPYSAQGVTLTPVQVAVYDYIKGCERLGNYGENFMISMKIFQKYWPNEYMILLD